MERPRRLVLLGHPVEHSLSPLIQAAAIAAAHLDVPYEAVDVAADNLEDLLRDLAREHVAGNVTIPHKRAAAAVCDRVTSLAAQVGAVNVWWTDDDELVGDNTDVFGAHAAAQSVLGHTPERECVAVFGAGGAASAVLTAVSAWAGSSARVYSRNPERAAALCARFKGFARHASTPPEALRGASIVVNSTPVGLNDDDMPIEPEILPRGIAVLDLVYGPRETAWVKAARARGHRAEDGLTMLVEQGALAFERWFGIIADRDAMRAAVPRAR